MAEGKSKIEAHAAMNELRDQDKELEGSPNEDANGERDGRTLKIAPDERGGKQDDREVQRRPWWRLATAKLWKLLRMPMPRAARPRKNR